MRVGVAASVRGVAVIASIGVLTCPFGADVLVGTPMPVGDPVATGTWGSGALVASGAPAAGACGAVGGGVDGGAELPATRGCVVGEGVGGSPVAVGGAAEPRGGSTAAGKTSSRASASAASRRAALATAGFSGASGTIAASQMP